jgi:hypothetical protein
MTSTSEIPAFITQMDDKLKDISFDIYNKSTYGVNYDQELEDWRALELFIQTFSDPLLDWEDHDTIARAERIQVRFDLTIGNFTPNSP